MAKPSMRASSQFNAKPKTSDHSGGALDERGRNRAVKGAWKSTTNELVAHQSQGIEVEPIRRAKIGARLARDHHRSERTSGKTRGIIKGRVG